MKPVRVLVIDDEESDHYLIRRSLEDHGKKVKITAAHSLSEALDYLRISKFDVVVLDLGLPDVSGSHSSTVGSVANLMGSARLIVHTGAASADTIWTCNEAGADLLVIKGIRTPTLPPLGVLVHGQALVARSRLRVAIEEEVLPTRSNWWGKLPPVQRGALAVATVGAAVQLAISVIERLIEPLVVWLISSLG